MKLINIVGQTFGRWTVLRRAENTSNGQTQWLCRCVCGTERVLKSILIRRTSQPNAIGSVSYSCGCLKLERLKERSTKHGHAPASGYSPTYSTWAAMKARCAKGKPYAKRGITVCERWNTFPNFLEDMGVKPKGKTLDRINNNGNYCKENCRWITMLEQSRNKRNNRNVTFMGETKTVAEWADLLGITQSSLHGRLSRKKNPSLLKYKK